MTAHLLGVAAVGFGLVSLGFVAFGLVFSMARRADERRTRRTTDPASNRGHVRRLP